MGDVFDLENQSGVVFDLEYVTYSEMCFGEVVDLESPISHYSGPLREQLIV